MKAILALEDGTVVEGEGWGAEGTALGELVFATPLPAISEVDTRMLTINSGNRFGLFTKTVQSSFISFRSKRRTSSFLSPDVNPAFENRAKYSFLSSLLQLTSPDFSFNSS